MGKERFNIEYVFDKASRSNLWSYLVTDSGLSDWFADDVLINGNTYAFSWNKHLLEAEKIEMSQNSHIRFQWIGEEDPEIYFEFRLHTNELTGALMLEITDFAEPSECQDAISLWDSQIKGLKRILGI